MLNQTRIYFFIILLFRLFAETAQASQEPKRKLAVLKISYDDFTPEERSLVSKAFYDNLARDERILVIPEAAAAATLQQSGTNPSQLDEVGYINAGKILKADYVLVGKMEKVGDFVEVSFRLFTVSQKFQKEYPGGKTMKMFVEQEIPKIVQEIQRDIEPPPSFVRQPSPPDTVRVNLSKPIEEKKPVKRSKWKWIALGGAATGGVVAAVLLSTGNDEGQQPLKGLPRPPAVP